MFGLFLFAAEKRYESVLVFHDSNDEQQTEYQLCDKSDKLKGVCGVTSGEAIDVGCNRENESDDDLEDVEEDTYIDDPAFFDTHKVWVDKVMAEEFVVSVCP